VVGLSTQGGVMKRILLLILAVALTACAAARLDRLQGTLLSYERAIRWSDFKTAFALADQPAENMPDLQRLENIRVTSYEKLGGPQVSADGLTLVQAAEVRYVNINRMSERTLMDKQVWTYVEKEERWKLTSPFPAFQP
jgi:hypothetical protein